MPWDPDVNLQLSDLLLLTALAVAAALFWRARRVHETAVRLTRRHCDREDVMLLDETVGLKKIRLRRDKTGRLRVARSYGFEFTVTGGERYGGETRMLGELMEGVTLEPHRFHDEPDRLH